MSELIESWKVSRYVVNVRYDDNCMIDLDGMYTGEPEVVSQPVYRTFELLLERMEELETELAELGGGR